MPRLNSRGFTLIEVILAMGIISLLLLMILPSTRLVSIYEERNSIDEFIRDIHYYKNKSIIEMNTYNIKVYPFENRYEIFGKVRLPIAKKKFNPRIKFGSINFKDNTITFTPRGISNSGTMSLIRSDGKVIKISIEVANSKINIRGE